MAHSDWQDCRCADRLRRISARDPPSPSLHCRKGLHRHPSMDSDVQGRTLRRHGATGCFGTGRSCLLSTAPRDILKWELSRLAARLPPIRGQLRGAAAARAIASSPLSHADPHVSMRYPWEQTSLLTSRTSSMSDRSMSANGMNPPSLLTVKIAAQAAACGNSKMSGASPTSAWRAPAFVSVSGTPPSDTARQHPAPAGP